MVDLIFGGDLDEAPHRSGLSLPFTFPFAPIFLDGYLKLLRQLASFLALFMLARLEISCFEKLLVNGTLISPWFSFDFCQLSRSQVSCFLSQVSWASRGKGRGGRFSMWAFNGDFSSNSLLVPCFPFDECFFFWSSANLFDSIIALMAFWSYWISYGSDIRRVRTSSFCSRTPDDSISKQSFMGENWFGDWGLVRPLDIGVDLLGTAVAKCHSTSGGGGGRGSSNGTASSSGTGGGGGGGSSGVGIRLKLGRVLWKCNESISESVGGTWIGLGLRWGRGGGIVLKWGFLGGSSGTQSSMEMLGPIIAGPSKLHENEWFDLFQDPKLMSEAQDARRLVAGLGGGGGGATFLCGISWMGGWHWISPDFWSIFQFSCTLDCIGTPIAVPVKKKNKQIKVCKIP